MNKIKGFAEAGLFLLKEATLLYLKENSPAKSVEIGRAVGTYDIEQPQGGQKGWMTGAILGELVREGKVERIKEYEGKSGPFFAVK